MRKKDILAYALDYGTPKSLASTTRSLFSNELMILAYHRIINIAADNSYPYDSELISASLQQFDYQMAYVKKHYNPISEAQLIDHIDNNIPLPPKSVMVTFDDGFDDNYHNAFPILQNYAIPATMFIATSYIDKNEPIWFDWLASLCIAGTMASIDVPLLGKKYLTNDYSSRSEIFKDLIVQIRKTDNDIRLAVMEQLASDYASSMTHIDKSMSRFMTWNQVTEMSRNNISIGSHTVTHPIMSQLKNDSIHFEIIESKRVIEAKIGMVVNSFSYPTGQSASFTPQITAAVVTAGYKVAHSYIHGVNKTPIQNPYALNRMHIESHVHNSYFNAMLLLPEIFRD